MDKRRCIECQSQKFRFGFNFIFLSLLDDRSLTYSDDSTLFKLFESVFVQLKKQFLRYIEVDFAVNKTTISRIERVLFTL